MLTPAVFTLATVLLALQAQHTHAFTATNTNTATDLAVTGLAVADLAAYREVTCQKESEDVSEHTALVIDDVDPVVVLLYHLYKHVTHTIHTQF